MYQQPNPILNQLTITSVKHSLHLSAIQRVFKDSQISHLINDQITQIQSIKNSEIIHIQTQEKYKEIHITILYPLKTEQYGFVSNSFHHIQFLMVLKKSFPISKPQVYLKSPITLPNINDSRDLFCQLLHDWNIKSRIKSVVQRIPQFLKRLCTLKKDIQFQKLGKFQLGKTYQFKFLSQLGGQQFLSFELGQQNIKLYVISQTQTHFLLFYPQKQPQFVDQKLIVPKQQQIEKITLIFMAQIQSLSQIKINKQNFLQYIFTFTSIKTRNMQFENISVVKKLKVANGFRLIEKILRCIRRYQQIKIGLDTRPQNNSQQKEILQEIAKKQQKLKHYLNLQTIQQMNKAYQAAVQFYSNKGAPYHQIYLGMISQMYTRKDVGLILQSVSIKKIPSNKSENEKVQKQ